LPRELASIATAVRAVYVTSDVNGNKMYSSGMFITPNVHPAHANTVAWAHGTTGIADQCAPSGDLTFFWPEAVNATKSYLQQGMSVAATDYQGLGTDGAHEYLIGNTEARSVIDSVRAARNLDANLTSSWVVAGHSQGGQAALFTGEIADSYGHGLNLKGVVAFAPASNEDILAPAIIGTAGQGYLVLALLGLAAADPTVDVSSILAQPAKDLLPVTQAGCFSEILHAYSNVSPTDLVVGGVLPDGIVAKLAHYGNPAQEPSSVPILLVQGTADHTVPPAITGILQSEECAYATPSFLQYINGATHDDVPSRSIDLVSAYISDRFAGVPAPSNCQ